jgi:predicted glycosyltransferase
MDGISDMNLAIAYKKISDIEQKYHVDTIEYEGIKIWPFIRWDICENYCYSDMRQTMLHRNKIMSYIKALLRMLITVSPKVLFLRRAVVLFTSDINSELRNINGKTIDIFAASVIEYEKKIIPIVTKKNPRYTTAFDNYINNYLLWVLVKLRLWTRRPSAVKINNRRVLSEIISELGIKYNINKKILQIYSLVVIFRRYFAFIKPVKLFIVCYYGLDRMAASYVAKEMDIPVIELQHSVILNNLFPYVTNIDIQKNPYPDYFFCFGEGFKKRISSYICKHENVLISGQYYIDFIKKNKNKNKKLFFEKYSHVNSRVIITVAGIDKIDFEMLYFIEQISGLCPEIYFIYIPRTVTLRHVRYSHINVSIETDLDVYQCMQNSHIMSTVYSSCAVESLALGTPVILINIHNEARFFYDDFFSSSDAVFYADTPEEYVLHIVTALNKKREQISLDAEYYYVDNPKERTGKALEIINKKYLSSIKE